MWLDGLPNMHFPAVSASRSHGHALTRKLNMAPNPRCGKADGRAVRKTGSSGWSKFHAFLAFSSAVGMAFHFTIAAYCSLATEDSSLRPTIITPANAWRKTSQPKLLGEKMLALGYRGMTCELLPATLVTGSLLQVMGCLLTSF